MRILPIFMIAGALTVAACGTTPAQMQLASCDGYAATLKELATLRTQGKLSASQISYVEAARPGLNAICYNLPDDVNAKALNVALDAGEKALESIVTQVEGK